MRRYLPLALLLAVIAHLSGCGENPNRPSVVTETPVNPPKTSARFIQVPWDISLFFNIPGGAIVAGATTAATSGNAAEGDNLTGTFVNSNGFAGTLTGVLTGNLDGGNFDGTLSTITPSGCTAERRFSGPVNAQGLNWSPGPQVNDCGGTSPLTSGIQAAAAPPTAPPPCTFAAAATGTSVPAAGGTGTVSVTAGTGCNWFATSSAGFVTLSGGQGTANGSVQFTVAANTAAAQRTAIVVVAGQSFTITQAGVPAPVCNYRLNGGERTFDAMGALGGVDMRVAAGCAWQAQSDAEWLTITSGASGSGDGTISYAVAPNPGLTQRVGRITATGDQDFTVTQLGIVCQFTLTPSTTSVPFTGGAASIAVVGNAAACPWTATVSPAAPWITITAGAAGTGNGTVALSFAANPTAQPRVGTVSVGTSTVAFTQGAARPVNLTFSWNPVTTAVDPENPACREAPQFPYCWRSTLTIVETSGTAATVTAWTVNLYNAAGVLTSSIQRTGADFADPTVGFGINPIPGGGTIVGARWVASNSPAGGLLDYVFSGTDAFGRTFTFRTPRLTRTAFDVPGAGVGLTALPSGPPVTVEGSANQGTSTIRREQ